MSSRRGCCQQYVDIQSDCGSQRSDFGRVEPLLVSIRSFESPASQQALLTLWVLQITYATSGIYGSTEL